MADNELFGNSEQLNDTISRQEALRIFEEHCYPVRYDHNSIERGMTLTGIVEVLNMTPPAQRWIPCSERLPEEEKAYLVTFANEKVGMSSWHKDTFNRGFNRGFDVYLIGVTEDGECEYFGVVAWMEKPEPWKGEDNG